MHSARSTPRCERLSAGRNVVSLLILSKLCSLQHSCSDDVLRKRLLSAVLFKNPYSLGGGALQFAANEQVHHGYDFGGFDDFCSFGGFGAEQ